MSPRGFVRAGVLFQVSFSSFSVGGTAAVAAGGGGKWRCQGCAAAAQGFSNMGHQEGVAGQLQHVHAVLFMIGQATSNEGLGRERGRKK